jgi:hypothetical protein
MLAVFGLTSSSSNFATITFLAKEHKRAKSYATVRQRTAGVVRIALSLSKKLDPSRWDSRSLAIKVETIADFPEPGKPLNKINVWRLEIVHPFVDYPENVLVSPFHALRLRQTTF